MDLDDLQKPNIGKPEFATGRSTGERKMWAIVTTIAFAIFWFSGLFLAAGLFGQQTMHWSAPVLAIIGLASDSMRVGRSTRTDHTKMRTCCAMGRCLPRLGMSGTSGRASDVLS
jgi:hypothetical protein